MLQCFLDEIWRILRVNNKLPVVCDDLFMQIAVPWDCQVGFTLARENHLSLISKGNASQTQART
jgi:hypothetical protein